MCIVFLSLAFALFFVPGEERYQMLRAWKLVMLLLGVLVLAHKAIALWFMLPHTQAVAPIWSQTCLHQWLGIVPLTAYEERQLQLTFVFSMLMISAHVRAVLKESRASLSGEALLADVPRETVQRSSLASSPLLDEHEGDADGKGVAGEGDTRDMRAATAGLAHDARASGSTLSADHWRHTHRLEGAQNSSANARVVTFDDGDEVDSGRGCSLAAADEAWLDWTLAQGAIGLALLALFYLFAAVKTNNAQGSGGGGSKQALAPVLMVLLILHALVARSCIHSVCQRLQVTVCRGQSVDCFCQLA